MTQQEPHHEFGPNRHDPFSQDPSNAAEFVKSEKEGSGEELSTDADVISPEEYPRIIAKLTEVVRRIRKAFQVLTMKSYEPDLPLEDAHDIEGQTAEFLNLRERLQGVKIEISTEHVRNYISALNFVVEKLAESETLARSQGHTVDSLRLLGKIFFDATRSPVLTAAEDGTEQTLLFHPKSSQIYLQTGESVPLAQLYQEALDGLSLEDLLRVNNTLGFFLWVQNIRKLIENAEIRSQLYIFVDALQMAVLEKIPTTIRHDVSSSLPQQRLKVIPAGQVMPEGMSETFSEDNSLDPLVGATVIGELVREPKRIDPKHKDLIERISDDNYRREWANRSGRSLNQAVLVPIASTEEEKDHDRLRSAVFPVGLRDSDVFNGAFWVTGMLDAYPDEGASMIDAFKHSSLKDLVNIASKHVGYFQIFEPIVKLLTIPEEITAINHNDLRAVINRNVIGCKRFLPQDYYTTGGKTDLADEHRGVDSAELLYLYTELCRGFDRSHTLEGLIGYLFPGMDIEDLMPMETLPMQTPYPHATIPSNRFKLLADCAKRYFSAIGLQRASDLMSSFFSNLSYFSQADWRRTKLFQSFKEDFAVEYESITRRTNPDEPTVEQGLRDYTHNRYLPLQEPASNACKDYDSAKVVGEILHDWRIREASLRLMVNGHSWQLDPRLNKLQGHTIPDIGEMLPNGPMIRVTRAHRTFFVEGGFTGDHSVVNAAILLVPEHHTVGVH